MAARNWKTQVIKYLLSKNADPNICDADGMSPVMHACRVGALSAIKVLVEVHKSVRVFFLFGFLNGQYNIGR